MIMKSLKTQAKEFGLDSEGNLQLLQDPEEGMILSKQHFYKINLAGWNWEHKRNLDFLAQEATTVILCDEVSD